MARRSLTDVLDECLEAMSYGATVADCLARYPAYADHLRPLLHVRQHIGVRAQPRPAAQAAAWDLVRHQSDRLRQAGHARPAARSSNPGAWGWLKPAAVAMGVAGLFLAAGGGTALAAQSSLPNSPLYGVKLATEDARLWFTFSDSGKADLLLDQSNTRVQEMTDLLQEDEPISGNVLSALHDRNQHAAEISADQPQNTDLRSRLLAQSQQQEDLLIAVWPNVEETARDDYTETLAVVHNTRLQTGGGAFVSISPEELNGGVLNVAGQAEPVSDGVWRVGGVEMRVDDRTIGQSSLQPGDTVRFAVGRSSNGRLHALTLSHVRADASPSGAVVSGAVQEVTDDGVRVAGQWIPITSATLLKFNIKQGDKVDVTLDNTSGGVVAGSVKPSGGESNSAGTTGFFTLEGTIQGDVRSTNEWTIAGLSFVNSPTIAVDAQAGDAEDGARALVDATVQGDQLIATRVIVLATQAPANTVFLAGSFQGLNDDGYWIVGGLPVIPPDNEKKPENGSQLAIQGTQIAGEITASHVQVIQRPDQTDILRFQGTILSINGTLWTLDIGQVRVTSTTDVDGKAIGGARVIVWGTQGEGGVLRPIYVRVLDANPVVATPSPASTAAH